MIAGDPSAGATPTLTRLAAMVATASDGEISAADALDSGLPLSELGFTSLAQMRLIDAVEAEFGVDIALTEDGLAELEDVRTLAAAIDRQRTG